MRLTRFALVILLFLAPAYGADYYVSLKGKDSNPGTLSKPFATLERARDAARANRTGGSATVWIRGGAYVLPHGFHLTAEDSGTVYQAYENETARLLGGKAVHGFRKVTDRAILARLVPAARGKVVAASLRAQGITNFGELAVRTSEQPVHKPVPLELFFDGKPMQLARWPNGDWAKIAAVQKGVEDRFQYEGDRPAHWAAAEDAWVHGFWAWDYVDSYLKVKAIDAAAHEIVASVPPGADSYKKGHRYYALNILEELDEPGEWYLDRKSGMLYFWPPASLRKGEADVSLLEEPIVTLDGASSVTLRGLTIECGRGDALLIRGGAGNLVKACTIRNVGNMGVRIENGERQSVSACDISQTGDGAVELAGGDRATLTPGQNSVEDCDLHEFGRWVLSYTPGVEVRGVGNRVAHNHIHDAPHFAVFLHGNDHVLEFNEVDHVVQETHDAGAFYIGHDYSERGHVVRYNYFHHLGREGVKPKDMVQGVYLDDCASGVRVYGNVFYRAGRAVQIGGGRDNTVENNIFVECDPCVVVDARGYHWAKIWFNGKDNTLINELKAMNYQQPPYSVRYPQLVTLFKDPNTPMPLGNFIVRNVAYSCRTWIDYQDKLTDKTIHVQDNFTAGDPEFVDPAHGNLQLRDDSPAYKLGFKQIPLDQIGPRKQ